MGCTTSKPSRTPILISLDGNIGAGKSTLCAALQAAAPELTVLQEPVGDWLTLQNEAGESLLSLFYKDTPRWAYTFQNCAVLTRLIATKTALEKGTTPVIITERSVLTDRYVFADMMYKEGKMSKLEWELYLKWYDAFAKDLPIKGLIYINTSPTLSKERIATRGRVGEESIPLPYLEALEAQHTSWFKETPLATLTLSAEDSIDQSIEKIRTFCKQFY